MLRCLQLEGDADNVFRGFLAFQADLYRVSTRQSRTVIKVPVDKVGLLIGASPRRAHACHVCESLRLASTW